MEKYKDSSSTLKDDSLSELYSPTQSMSLYSRFSRSIRSLSISSFFFSLIYCFQRLANLPLAFSFSHETAAKAFLVGTSGPKGQVEFWQNTIGEISLFALWVREPPQIFIFLLLWTCTFTCSRTRYATNRVRGVASILFRKACRQTATIATSCSIWPHEILAFSTSVFPSFYSSYIIVHFQVNTMQSHATQLISLYTDAVMWVTLPVSYFLFRLCLSRRRWEGGSGVFVWVFLKGHALIHSGKWEGHDFFRKKFLKYPDLTHPQ